MHQHKMILLRFRKKKTLNKQIAVAAAAICVLIDVTEIFISLWKSTNSIFYPTALIIHFISGKAK